MTRTMYDSTNAANIPVDAELVAGYADLWSAAEFARFTKAVWKLVISRSAGTFGHCLDVETGDATPAQAPGWVQRQRDNGGPEPWVYCNQSTWPNVRAQFVAAKVAEPLYWIAKLGAAVLDSGTIATQYDFAGLYDLSVVADHVPGLDPAPSPPPPPEEHMETTFIQGTVNGVDAIYGYLRDEGWIRLTGSQWAAITAGLGSGNYHVIIDDTLAALVDAALSASTQQAPVSANAVYVQMVNLNTLLEQAVGYLEQMAPVSPASAPPSPQEGQGGQIGAPTTN